MPTNLKRLASLIIAPLAAMSIVITSHAQTKEEPTKAIADLVVESGGDFDGNYKDYYILLNTAFAAGLEDALADPTADLTVFAPNNRAFIRLARDLGYLGRKEEDAVNEIVGALAEPGGGNPIQLTNVLLYHVFPETKSLREIGTSDNIRALFTASSQPIKSTLLPRP